jgi:hypothetical protein
MKLLIAARGYCALLLLLAVSMLHGCASDGSRIVADQLRIDKISSGQVSIGPVYARKTDGGMDVAGKVKLKRAMMGDPPYHMGVTIIDPEGKLLYSAYTHYYRYGKPTKESDTFKFSLTIPLKPPKGSIIRLVNEAPS